MEQILVSCREAAVASLILIPLFYILNRYYFRNQFRSAAYLIFSIYLAAMYAAAGLPDIMNISFHPRCNFRVFLYMFSAWETTLLNVLLFIPLGIFLPLLWQKYRSAFSTVFLGFQISFLIELLQLFTKRATDINDLITNTAGTILGFLLAKLILKYFSPSVPCGQTKDLWVIVSSVFVVMYFIYPAISSTIFL